MELALVEFWLYKPKTSTTVEVKSDRVHVCACTHRWNFDFDYFLGIMLVIQAIP